MENPSDRLTHIMPPIHFFLLENMLKSWFVGDKKPIKTQPLLDTLPENERWSFWDRCDDFDIKESRRYCPGVIDDIKYLHQRGYVYIQGKSRDDRTWLIDLCTGTLLLYEHVYNEDPKKVNWKDKQVKLLEDR